MNISLAIRRALLDGPKTKDQLTALCGKLVGASQARNYTGTRKGRRGGRAQKTEQELLSYNQRQIILCKIRWMERNGIVQGQEGHYSLTDKGKKLTTNNTLPPDRKALLDLLNSSEGIPFRRGALALAKALGQLSDGEYETLVQQVQGRKRIRNPNMNGENH